MSQENPLSERGTAARGSSGAEVALGALAAVVAASLAVVLAAGGLEASFFGLSVRSHTPARPLLILLGVLAARWLVSARRRGTGVSVRSFTALWMAAAGVVIFAGVLLVRPSAVYWWVSAGVGALAVLGFAFGWLAWGGPSQAASRAVVTVLYLGLSAGLAASLSDREAWGGRWQAPQDISVGPTDVPADRAGLLAGAGSGIGFRKAAVGNDWRDAAAVSPGGFFSAKVSAGAGDILEFSAASTAKPRGASCVVTAVRRAERKVLWEEDASSLGGETWRDVSLPLSLSGEFDVVFEVTGPPGEGAVLFANPRIKADRKDRTNFIFILVDALRADRLGLYGCERNTSAEIDALAADAVVFDHCVSPSSWTPASMASLFTSFHPTVHGVFKIESGLPRELATMSERFLAAGYVTGAFQVNLLLTPDRGFSRGFGEYFSFPFPGHKLDGKELYVSAEEVNAKAFEWLDRHSAEPFFLYLHYMDVHDPYEPPQEFRTFGSTDFDLYDGSIAYFSSQFALLFDELRRRGLLENTVVVLTGDHGEQFLEHGFNGHRRSLYVEETHVPLMFWLPGHDRMRRVSTGVCGVDVAVTLLELAGLEPFANVAGRSLVPAIEGGQIEPVPVFAELLKIVPNEYLVALTRDGRRFIESCPGAGKRTRVELYDLAKDPAEKTNIAAGSHDIIAAMGLEVEEFISTQEKLRAQLVKEDFVKQISEDEAAQLKAVGYLAPGSPEPQSNR